MRLFVRLKPTGRTRQHMICHDYHFRLQGRANPLHTTDAAHCWQRRTEASLRHRTGGRGRNRCNLPVCTIHPWRRSTTVEPVIYCSDRSKGRQALDHRKFPPPVIVIATIRRHLSRAVNDHKRAYEDVSMVRKTTKLVSPRTEADGRLV